MARYGMDYGHRGSSYGGYGSRAGRSGAARMGGTDYGYGNFGGGGNQGGGYGGSQGGGYGGRSRYGGHAFAGGGNRGGMRYDTGYQGGGSYRGGGYGNQGGGYGGGGYGMDRNRGGFRAGGYGGYGGSQGGGYGSRGYADGGYGNNGGLGSSNVRASDVMTEAPETVSADTTLAEAAKRMRDLDVGIMPVVDSEQSRRLKGVITDRDIAVRAVAEGKDVKTAKVSEFMSADVETCNKNDSMRDVMELMRREQVRRVPITDREGRLVGIIAQADLVTDYAGDRPQRERMVEDTVQRISEPGRPQRGGMNASGRGAQQSASANRGSQGSQASGSQAGSGNRSGQSSSTAGSGAGMQAGSSNTGGPSNAAANKSGGQQDNKKSQDSSKS